MKKFNVLVAVVALLAATTAVNAADQAWFSLEGSSDALVTAEGGGGQTLVITKPLGPSTTVLTIGYNFTNTVQYQSPATMNGYGFALGGATDVSYGGVDQSAGTAKGYDFSQDFSSASDMHLRGTSNTQIGGSGLVATFELTITKATAGGTIDIFGQMSAQPTTAGFAWFGDFGASSNHYGLFNYGGGPFGGNDNSLPLITINNVPEPATFALLGIGAFALIRRRR